MNKRILLGLSVLWMSFSFQSYVAAGDKEHDVPDTSYVFSFHHRRDTHPLGALNVMRVVHISDFDDFYSMIDNGTDPKPDAKSSRSENPVVEVELPKEHWAFQVRYSEAQGEYFVSQPSRNDRRFQVHLYRGDGSRAGRLRGAGDSYEISRRRRGDASTRVVTRMEGQSNLRYPGNAQNVGGHAVVEILRTRLASLEYDGDTQGEHQDALNHRFVARDPHGRNISRLCEWTVNKEWGNYWQKSEEGSWEEIDLSEKVAFDDRGRAWIALMWRIGNPGGDQLIDGRYYGRSYRSETELKFTASYNDDEESAEQRISIGKGQFEKAIPVQLEDTLSVTSGYDRDNAFAVFPQNEVILNPGDDIPRLNQRIAVDGKGKIQTGVETFLGLVLNAAFVAGHVNPTTAVSMRFLLNDTGRKLSENWNSTITWQNPRIVGLFPDRHFTYQWRLYKFDHESAVDVEETSRYENIIERANIGLQTDKVVDDNKFHSFLYLDPKHPSLPAEPFEGMPRGDG